MKKLYRYIVVFAAVLLTSCVEETFEFIAQDKDLPVRISSVYPVTGTATRADANGFVADDEVGIFIVDYNRNGSPGVLKMNDVRAANALFSYNGTSWDAPYQIYWANNEKYDLHL